MIDRFVLRSLVRLMYPLSRDGARLDVLLSFQHLRHYVTELVEVGKCASVDLKVLLGRSLG